MPVQWVNRPNLDFRGYAGTIAAGTVRPGDAVARRRHPARPAACRASSRWTATWSAAGAGEAVTLTLADQIDISRGDVLAQADAPPAVADQFDATSGLAGRSAAVSRPHLSAQARHAHASPAASAASATASTSTRFEHIARRHAGDERRRARVNFR